MPTGVGFMQCGPQRSIIYTLKLNKNKKKAQPWIVFSAYENCSGGQQILILYPEAYFLLKSQPFHGSASAYLGTSW